MTTEKIPTTFDPYSVTLWITSEENLFYAPSSDGYSVYAVYFHSENEVTCTCEGFEKYHVNCRHRRAAMLRFNYITPLDGPSEAQWNKLLNRIEDASEKASVDELFTNEAA